MAEMKSSVYVGFEDKMLVIDNDPIRIDTLSIETIQNVLSDSMDKSKITNITWHLNIEGQTFLNLNGACDLFDNTEENYNKFVKPFVDLWQAEKDRLEQQTQEAQAEYNKFENRQARALNQLSDLFEQAKLDARVISSLGFEIDANHTANENITGLLVTIGDGTTQFCDYNNVFHEVNKTDLETMQTEIIQNAQYLYQQKWSYRTQIEECTEGDALDEILAQIEFKYKDFTQ